MKYILIIYLFLVVCPGIFSQDFSFKISTRNEFDELSGLPLSDNYGEVSAIKIVYEIHTDRLYFLSSKYYKYHYEFCFTQLGFDPDLNYFNKLNYSNSPNREYLLGNLNYFIATGKYVLDISAFDQMPVKTIVAFYNKVALAVFPGKDLYFFINSARLQEEIETIRMAIPVITPSEIYSGNSYQSIGEYCNTGILRFFEDNTDLDKKVNPEDIIVIKETPDFLPAVAGIIVTEFQTPLSHLSILGQTRKIPICAYKQAFEDTVLLQNADKSVRFTVKGNDFKIEPSATVDIRTSANTNIDLKYYLDMDSLIEVQFFNRKSGLYIGNKASNFGILYRLSKRGGFKTPESAFAIPFYFYNAHVERSSVKNLIHKLNTDATVYSNIDSVKTYLQIIRDGIMNTPFDSVLLTNINNKIKSLGSYTRMRFRSSTNAEDAPGFSGAGLYLSETGILNSTTKPIDLAVKKVWASLWLYDAYFERKYFNMDQEKVFMGILVHRSFASEKVNGVAITKNIYRENSNGFVVNAQLGDESVVRPKDGIECDQFICYPENSMYSFDEENAVDVISISNLNNGKMVMTEAEIHNLANQLEMIKEFFISPIFSSTAFLKYGLDLEFKLDGENRQLYIKQVRVYND